MLERFGSFILVTAITILIWVFAEGQSVQTTTRVVTIDLISESNDLAVRVIDQAWARQTELALTGSTSALDSLRDDLAQGISLIAGQDFSADPGEQTLGLLEIIRKSSLLHDSGVSVSSIEPATVQIIIERLVDVEAQVIVLAPAGVLAGPPTATPTSVHITMPEPAAIALGENPTINARVTQQRLEPLDTGRPHTLPDVRLERPTALDGVSFVSIDPASVDVSLTLLDLTQSVTVASVPVHLKVSSLAFNDFQVEVLDQFLSDVTISGPSEQIALLPTNAAGEPRLTATVTLSADELERASLEGNELTKDAIFAELPSTLTFQAGTTSVRLRITRRQPPAPTPTSGD